MSRSPDPDLAALQADERVVWTEDVIRFGDTDANGHVNNSAFSFFCESGRVNILHDRLKGVLGAGGFFSLARIVIEFRAELHYPGRVRCGTWVSAMGRTSVGFAQVLLDDGGRLAAISQAVTVAMDGPTRRPMPLTPDMRARIGPLVREG